MNKPIKILRLILLLFVVLIVILFSASLIMQGKMSDFVIRSLNNNLSTKLSAESLRFSLISKFPRASVELKGIVVYSSPDYNRSDFPGISTDTLLSARSASVELRLLDILKKDYNIAGINIKSGNLNLLTDSSGLYNFKISKETPSDNDVITLNINKINLFDVSYRYYNQKNQLAICGIIDNGKLKGKISGKKIDFNSDSRIVIEHFSLKNTTIKNHVPVRLMVDLYKSDYSIVFRNAKLTTDYMDIILTGSVFDDNDLDLNVKGRNMDISEIPSFFTGKYKDLISEHRFSGKLKLESSIKGYSTPELNPHVEILFSLDNAHIHNELSKRGIDNLSFRGFYSNGAKNITETSTFFIKDFVASLGSAIYKGSFIINDFTTLRSELVFKGTLYPDEITDFLNLKKISSASGTIELDLKFSGNIPKEGKLKLYNILELNQQSRITFRSFGIKTDDKLIDLKDVNGTVTINQTTSTDNLNLLFNGQNINLRGNFTNFPQWLTGNPVTLSGTINLSAGTLKPEHFLRLLHSPPEKTGINSAFVFPGDVMLDINFKIDTLLYKTFNADNIAGTLSYKPYTLIFKTLSLNSQKGFISGNWLVVQNRNKSFICKGNFALEKIDVYNTFNTFNNFGQNFIKAENLGGSLSGSVSILLPTDSLLKPEVKSLTAEGKFVLSDGLLIDFEPVKALSSFIQLSELQNIKFDEMQNDFFIGNNFIYFPKMDVSSSAVDLSVSGRHNFNNDYEYHVKMLLSELLSKKARKNKSSLSELGEVEDDGLGRTSVFLKVDNKGGKTNVSYDIKAAGEQVKNDLRKERENLKKILDEEYRYKSTSRQTDSQPGRPRFRISWEDNDTIITEPESPSPKKESAIKKIFKRNNDF